MESKQDFNPDNPEDESNENILEEINMSNENISKDESSIISKSQI